MKRVTIDPITRLEGHGKIEIFLNEHYADSISARLNFYQAKTQSFAGLPNKKALLLLFAREK